MNPARYNAEYERAKYRLVSCEAVDMCSVAAPRRSGSKFQRVGAWSEQTPSGCTLVWNRPLEVHLGRADRTVPNFDRPDSLPIT
jgi:hypothetical protein